MDRKGLILRTLISAKKESNLKGRPSYYILKKDYEDKHLFLLFFGLTYTNKSCTVRPET